MEAEQRTEQRDEQRDEEDTKIRMIEIPAKLAWHRAHRRVRRWGPKCYGPQYRAYCTCKIPKQSGEIPPCSTIAPSLPLHSLPYVRLTGPYPKLHTLPQT